MRRLRLPTQLLDFDNCSGREFPCPYCVYDARGYRCKGNIDFGAAKYVDNINSPEHYNQAGIEVIDVIEAYAPTNYHLGNVIKYVCRSGHKGSELMDWKKARWYLDRLITTREKDDGITVSDISQKQGNS